LALSYRAVAVSEQPNHIPGRPVSAGISTGRVRRPRYPGKYPKRFDQKYKERNPERFPGTIQKVLASGKTPAGMHRPIMVEEVQSVLEPRSGEVAIDCTLGYGGHAQALLCRLLPNGKLVGIDQDPIELPRTEARLRAAGFGPEVFVACRSNFASLAKVLAGIGLDGADLVLADLGVSSMQLDDPGRGFSVKQDGPLDMRMNPGKSRTASMLLQTISARALTDLLAENSDERFADVLGKHLAGGSFPTTRALVSAIRSLLARSAEEEIDLTIRRTFQALRIAVNDEFSALDTFLRQLPSCLRPGARVAILSFHSGEDRRVKKAFAAGLQSGVYEQISSEVIRPSPIEKRDNPRSASARLRWARTPGRA
jgi:16S rRNA (cytosine1402-N4)-methyltransferase